MSKSLKLPDDVKERASALLGDKRPTAVRLLSLFDELQSRRSAMDQSDIEHERTPYTPRDHAEAVVSTMKQPPEGFVDEAVGQVLEGRAERLVEGPSRVRDRIVEHAARGLDPDAPPEDPEAAALAEEETTAVPAPPLIQASAVMPEAPLDLSRAVNAFERREREVLSRLPKIMGQGGGRIASLEQAAAVIVQELEPAERDAIDQVCQEERLEPWMVVAAAVKRMAQLQELHAGEYNPEWRNMNTRTPATVREQRCEMCAGLLPADARKGQKFCCSPHGSDQTRHAEGCPCAHMVMERGQWVDMRTRPVPVQAR